MTLGLYDGRKRQTWVMADRLTCYQEHWVIMPRLAVLLLSYFWDIDFDTRNPNVETQMSETLCPSSLPAEHGDLPVVGHWI